MRRVGLAVLAIAIVSVTGLPVLSQGQGQRQGLRRMPSINPALMLLAQKSVQEDLKLSDDQVQKVQAAAQKQQEAFGETKSGNKIEEAAKQADKEMAAVLTAEQRKRLKEILLQTGGIDTFLSPEVIKELGLTKEQQEEIGSMRERAARDAQAVPKAGKKRGDVRVRYMALSKEATVKVVAMLMPEQKEKWQKMTGKPFQGEITFGGGRRGR
jgi:hypothetical protein